VLAAQAGDHGASESLIEAFRPLIWIRPGHRGLAKQLDLLI
jgi:hypothetical protein